MKVTFRKVTFGKVTLGSALFYALNVIVSSSLIGLVVDKVLASFEEGAPGTRCSTASAAT
ncbi:hypothetical protein [Streptomyces cyaneofuscatus]|uniref:hypothetical protein n=1 Tax=Streptomyces cyaneofuscatus TaxID=66883 RepID=UPI0036B945B4